jgi:hypothetical protein
LAPPRRLEAGERTLVADWVKKLSGVLGRQHTMKCRRRPFLKCKRTSAGFLRRIAVVSSGRGAARALPSQR